MQAAGPPGGTSHHRQQVEAAVRAGPLMSIPTLLLEFGCKPEPLFESVGVTLAQFAEPDTEVSYLAASKLLARCASATRCTHFGLLVGQRAGPSHLGVAGFLLRSAPDVETALRDLARYLDLHDQGGSLTLKVENELTLLGYAVHQPDAQAVDQIYDLSIAVACNLMRNLCGQRWNPTDVYLARREPRHPEPYREFFRAPLHFDANQSALAFPCSWLGHRLASADALLHRHLEREADKLHTMRADDIAGELRRLLTTLIAEQRCSIDEVARRMGIHERTLNRRLQQQGTSFRRELDEVRYTLARQLLSDTEMPVTEIANTLAYSDASAFGHAFKRWSGASPAHWRTRNVRP
jgi:AraC-like DNA-binding protein